MEPKVIIAYLHGAFHDGTSNRFHKTFRFCQKEREWLERLQDMLQNIGFNSWIYREGKDRNLYILETTAKFLKDDIKPTSFLTLEEKIAYIRGYFDAEGGIPQNIDHWLYIQLSQKNELELIELKILLEEMGIKCGKVHIPSRKVDENYFRFFIARQSHQEFITKINSWHPRKEKIFQLRMKI
jgi:hypothetical protein